jgi:hypothetical protein
MYPATSSYFNQDVNNIIEKVWLFQKATTGTGATGQRLFKNARDASKDLQFSSSAVSLYDNLASCGDFNDLKFVSRFATEEANLTSGSIRMNEYGGLRFSAGDSPMVPGNWTVASLNMVVQEVGSSMSPTFILSEMFPDMSVPQQTVFLDKYAPNTGALPPYVNGATTPLPVVNPLQSKVLQYQSGLFGARTIIDDQTMAYVRQRGNPNFGVNGLAQTLAVNTQNLLTQAYTRKKLLISETIFNNGFNYDGASINSNIPTANFLSMTPIGSISANGTVTYNTDPLYNPLTVLFQLVNNPAILKYRQYMRGIVFNSVDLSNIMNHPAVKAVTNAWTTATAGRWSTNPQNMQSGILNSILTYYNPSFEIPLIGDTDVWQDQTIDGQPSTSPNDFTNPNSAQRQFIPTGKAVILMDFSRAGGMVATPIGSFINTINKVDPAMQAMGLFTGVFTRNLTNSDNINSIQLVTALAGAPALYRNEAIFVLKDIYSNIP